MKGALMGEQEEPVFNADQIETDGPEVDGQKAELAEGEVEDDNGNA